MDNSVQNEVNNSTHNEINIVGNNNKFGNVSISSRCTLKSKIMRKINERKGGKK